MRKYKPVSAYDYAELAAYCNDNGCIIYETDEYLESVPNEHTPTDAEQKQYRAAAYRIEVDNLTAHISRLRDDEPTEEIAAKIAELQAERAAKIAEIKERYPYHEQNSAE